MGAREYDPRTARWLQKDAIDVASGAPNLYRYCRNDPVNAVDPSGLDWLDDATNFFAGVGDSLTFGLTNWIREQIGSNEAVDRCSNAYVWGERIEVATEVLLSLGSYGLTKLAIRKGGALASRVRRHRELQRVENALRLNTNRYTVPARFLRNECME